MNCQCWAKAVRMAVVREAFVTGNAQPWNSGYRYRYMVHKNANGNKVITRRRVDVRKDMNVELSTNSIRRCRALAILARKARNHDLWLGI